MTQETPSAPPARLSFPRRLARWLSRLLLLVLLGALGETAIFTVTALTLPDAAPTPPNPTQARGAYHVHTTASDGRWSADEIAASAARAGLQFVIFTDHNVVQLPPPRFVQGVLLIFATELSTPWGHVVALDLKSGLTEAERNREDVLEQVHRQEGVAFLAHPVQAKNPWRNEKLAAQADGLELYSGDSLYRAALRHPVKVLLPVLGTYLARPSWGLWMLARADPEVRQKLVTLSRARRLEALCALDAHGWPSYEAPFRALSLYLETGEPLSPEASVAAKQVTAALRGGSFHCGFGDWASADGFQLRGELDAERRAPVGAALEVVLPASPPAQTRLDVFGPAHWDEQRHRLVLDAPGPVWVEVWVRPEAGLPVRSWRPWIVASPIRAL